MDRERGKPLVKGQPITVTEDNILFDIMKATWFVILNM